MGRHASTVAAADDLSAAPRGAFAIDVAAVVRDLGLPRASLFPSDLTSHDPPATA